MRRLRSFTIVELSISLLISGIVISSSYYALLFFNKQLASYRKKTSNVNSFMVLKRSLQRDFDSSSIITDSSGDLIIQNQGKINPGSRYHFEKEFVVRSVPEEKDTFILTAHISALGYMSDSLALVNYVALSVRLEDQIIRCRVSKKYTADELIQAEKIINEQ